MRMNRRQFGTLVAGVPLARAFQATAPHVETRVNGVQFGLETFSFHDLPPSGNPRLVPTIVRQHDGTGVAECEIMSAHVEPFPGISTGWWVQARRAPGFQQLREEARRWRLTVPMEHYASIRRQFDEAGLQMHLYNVNFNETFTDAERDRTFEAAKALGAAGFSSSTVISEARRLVPFAERHRDVRGDAQPQQPGGSRPVRHPESFETALAMSPRFKVTLDIGHFTAGNQDPVAFIRKHHDRIVNIHVRDRERNNGPNRPFGQGHTPIREVLRLIRDERYPIRCYLEYEYGSFRYPLEELQTCFQYCKDALA